MGKQNNENSIFASWKQLPSIAQLVERWTVVSRMHKNIKN